VEGDARPVSASRPRDACHVTDVAPLWPSTPWPRRPTPLQPHEHLLVGWMVCGSDDDGPRTTGTTHHPRATHHPQDAHHPQATHHPRTTHRPPPASRATARGVVGGRNDDGEGIRTQGRRTNAQDTTTATTATTHNHSSILNHRRDLLMRVAWRLGIIGERE
jgi:hypothetical protein